MYDTADAGDGPTAASSAGDNGRGRGAGVSSCAARRQHGIGKEAVVAVTPTRAVVAAEVVEEDVGSPATPTLADWEISEVGLGDPGGSWVMGPRPAVGNGGAD